MATTNKTVVMRFRCTEGEAAEIRMRAIGMDLSKYLRLRALAQPLTADEATPLERVVLGDKATTPLAGDAPMSEQDIEDLTRKLKGQGMTTPVARREARKRLGP